MDSPVYGGHDDLTCSKPSPGISQVVNLINLVTKDLDMQIKLLGGIRLKGMALRIKTRIDDSRAPPGTYYIMVP
jgi:hypothetical protein